MPARYSELRGQRILITGAASGIGEATARRFIEEGSRVALLDVNGEALKSAFPQEQKEILRLTADVADPDAVDDAFTMIDQQFGGIDVIFANAGISIRHDLMSMTADEWRRVIDVNLHGVFYTAMAAAKRMLAEKRGVIVLMGSTNGMRAHRYYMDYNVSKAGVIMLAKSMALELAPHVRVNSICPGYVLTPMQRAEYTDEMLAEVNNKIPLGRHADPSEVAALVAFLASDEARYITAQHLPIDGGETA